MAEYTDGRVRTATGTYRLDPISAAFFDATVIRFIHRDGSVIGRFGRHGSIRGSMTDGVLSASWKDQVRDGWMKLAFDGSYRLFEGEYGTGDETTNCCTGEKAR